MPRKKKAPELNTAVEQERDYTAEREAEVVPVARELLKRIAARTDLAMGNQQNLGAEAAAEYYQKVYLEDLIPVLLEKNVKLGSLKYLFTLLMSPMDALSEVAAGEDNDPDVVPLARAILLKIANAPELPLVITEKNLAEYREFYAREVLPLIAESKVKTVSYAIQLLRQPFQLLLDITLVSFNTNRDLADALKYGVEDIMDLTVPQLDKALKEGFAEKKAREEAAK